MYNRDFSYRKCNPNKPPRLIGMLVFGSQETSNRWTTETKSWWIWQTFIKRPVPTQIGNKNVGIGVTKMGCWDLEEMDNSDDFQKGGKYLSSRQVG